MNSGRQELDTLIAAFCKLEPHQRDAFFAELPRDHPFRGEFLRANYEICKAESELVAEFGGDDEPLSPRSAAELLVRRRDGR